MSDQKTTKAEPKVNVASLRAEDIMIAAVHAVIPTMSIKEVVDLFLEKGISGSPIVDQNYKVMSVISQSDLIQFLALDGMTKTVIHYLPRLPKVEQIVRVRKSDSFKDIFKQFLQHPVRRIIVTDDNGHLQGIVSKSTLLRAFRNSEP
jgi:predicted transcriptional regulator